MHALLSAVLLTVSTTLVGPSLIASTPAGRKITDEDKLYLFTLQQQCLIGFSSRTGVQNDAPTDKEIGKSVEDCVSDDLRKKNSPLSVRQRP